MRFLTIEDTLCWMALKLGKGAPRTGMFQLRSVVSAGTVGERQRVKQPSFMSGRLSNGQAGIDSERS
jgi:hypothetical protein